MLKYVEIANWFTICFECYISSLSQFLMMFNPRFVHPAAWFRLTQPFRLGNSDAMPSSGVLPWRAATFSLGNHQKNQGMQEVVSQILWHIIIYVFCCWILKSVYDLWTCKSPKWFFRIGKVYATLKIVEPGSIKVLDFWTCTNGEVERPIWGFP